MSAKTVTALLSCLILLSCTRTAEKAGPGSLTEPGEHIIETTGDMHWLQREKVKVAAGQVVNDENAYAVMLEYIDRAGAEGCDMIVLPEYIAGIFSDPIRETDKVYRIAQAARKNQIYVIVGGWEEFEPGAVAAKKEGAFANTAILFDRKGEVVGKYSKMHAAVGRGPHWWPPLPDQSEWLMKAGEGFPVFELDFGRGGTGPYPVPARCRAGRLDQLAQGIRGKTPGGE